VELLVKNELKEDVYIRPLAYKNDMPMDQRLHVLKDGFLLLAMPYGSYLGSDSIKCCVSSWRRPDFNVIPPQMKAAGLYINNALAKTEAIQNGFDEAIMLSPDGFVSEGSGENIFVVMEGKLITPPTYHNILKGVTRDTIMKLAENELGVETIERPIDRGELYLADECFMCGTGAHLVPVNEIDHRIIGNGEIGQITKKLMSLYHDVIKGNNSKYMNWCTPVF
jgi:branched-chain amino acid aminotransferase